MNELLKKALKARFLDAYCFPIILLTGTLIQKYKFTLTCNCCSSWF